MQGKTGRYMKSDLAAVKSLTAFLWAVFFTLKKYAINSLVRVFLFPPCDLHIRCKRNPFLISKCGARVTNGRVHPADIL